MLEISYSDLNVPQQWYFTDGLHIPVSQFYRIVKLLASFCSGVDSLQFQIYLFHEVSIRDSVHIVTTFLAGWNSPSKKFRSFLCNMGHWIISPPKLYLQNNYDST